MHKIQHKIYHKAVLEWVTPNLQDQIMKIVRVSTSGCKKSTDEQLLKYLIQHNHWSPFEMGSMCLKIFTTRSIAQQILRHRSFTFQVFSYRYANAKALIDPRVPARLQDVKNRQSSIPTDDHKIQTALDEVRRSVNEHSFQSYKKLRDIGIAKELARDVLPEGITPSTLYMSGTIRSWIHYIKLRTHGSTQYEHRLIANDAKNILLKQFNNKDFIFKYTTYKQLLRILRLYPFLLVSLSNTSLF